MFMRGGGLFKGSLITTAGAGYSGELLDAASRMLLIAIEISGFPGPTIARAFDNNLFLCCCLMALSLLYIGPNLFLPPLILSGLTAEIRKQKVLIYKAK